MPESKPQKNYHELAGEISVQWNYLERDLHVLGFLYLGGDSDVASRIFASMGNVCRNKMRTGAYASVSLTF